LWFPLDGLRTLFKVPQHVFESLTALGFKSFADKTTLNFVQGLRPLLAQWMRQIQYFRRDPLVLGEQSAKACAAAKWPT